jgi:hypothetical protein
MNISVNPVSSGMADSFDELLVGWIIPNYG